MKRRACVVISYEKLERALNLRPGLAIVAVKGEPRTEEAQIFLVGEELPETPRREDAINVDLRELLDLD